MHLTLTELDTDIESIIRDFKIEITAIRSIQELHALKVKYFGKNGIISILYTNIIKIASNEKKDFGLRINKLKTFIESELDASKIFIENSLINSQLSSERIDISLPGYIKTLPGLKHIITHTIEELSTILESIGFQQVFGPEIESDIYNFTKLNMCEYHPARHMHDTFYINKHNLLLRTHTSNIQIRYMEQNKPPIKIYSTGKVYRSDSDATHTPMFHQLESLWIDQNVTIAHLIEYVTNVLKIFFKNENLKMRIRPSYFPFTSPSFEIDISLDLDLDLDRNIDDEHKIHNNKPEKWLEVLGCGMVHRNVLQNVGIVNTFLNEKGCNFSDDYGSNVDNNINKNKGSIHDKKYQGFAFGLGIERLAMLKYEIQDIRQCFNGDIRWLKHYGKF